MNDAIFNWIFDNWVVFALLVVSVIFEIYGLLLYCNRWTPIKAKIIIEEAFLKKWCKETGVVDMIWGVDVALYAMYHAKVAMPYLWLAMFLALTVYCIYRGYMINQKYRKEKIEYTF